MNGAASASASATATTTSSNNYHNDDSNNNTISEISDSELTPPLSNKKKQRRNENNGANNPHSNRRSNNMNITSASMNKYYGSMNEPNVDESRIDPSSSSQSTTSLSASQTIATDTSTASETTTTTNVSSNNNHNSNKTNTGTRTTNRANVVRWPKGTPTSTNTGLSSSLLSQSHEMERSGRSFHEHKLNQWLECTIVTIVVFVITMSSALYWYYHIHQQHVMKHIYQEAVTAHAKAAQERRQNCYHIDWQTACDRLTNKAGARVLIIDDPSDTSTHIKSSTSYIKHPSKRTQHKRHSGTMSHGTTSLMNHHHHRKRHHRPISHDSNNHARNMSIPASIQEQELLDSDDPSVTYDTNCLKVYRLDINHGQITFPYHSSQLLRLGGNQTMVLIVQHGALRNSEAYFCSFKQLMLQQTYRNINDILIVAPDFNYATDDLVHPSDAVWNSSKPWGDWRVGAESDPYGIADMTISEDGTTTTTTKKNKKLSKWSKLFDHVVLRPTISSFDVLDNILAMLTDRRLYPNIEKISFVGHSAGKLFSFCSTMCIYIIFVLSLDIIIINTIVEFISNQTIC
jgi:hypoxanthine phosphoribosyltransferase